MMDKFHFLISIAIGPSRSLLIEKKILRLNIFLMDSINFEDEYSTEPLMRPVNLDALHKRLIVLN